MDIKTHIGTRENVADKLAEFRDKLKDVKIPGFIEDSWLAKQCEKSEEKAAENGESFQEKLDDLEEFLEDVDPYLHNDIPSKYDADVKITPKVKYNPFNDKPIRAGVEFEFQF